jgi:hypothetical protein
MHFFVKFATLGKGNMNMNFDNKKDFLFVFQKFCLLLSFEIKF